MAESGNRTGKSGADRLPADPYQCVRPGFHRHGHIRGASPVVDALPGGSYSIVCRDGVVPADRGCHRRARIEEKDHGQGRRSGRAGQAVPARYQGRGEAGPPRRAHWPAQHRHLRQRRALLHPRQDRPVRGARPHDPGARGVRRHPRSRRRRERAQGGRPGLHGAGRPRSDQPGQPPRHLQSRSGGALLGDAADPRHPAPGRDPPCRLHLQAAGQRLAAAGGDGRAAGDRRARLDQGCRSSRGTSRSSPAPAPSASSPCWRHARRDARASSSATSTTRSWSWRKSWARR